MRDLISGGGEGDPAKKPPPSRPDLRFPAASGARAEPARPAAAVVGEDPGALFTEIHLLMAELHDAVGRGASLPIGPLEAVLEHHEREQGQGYPQGLPGSAIHPHAKILGLVDTYTRLTSPRPPQARLLPHEAIREIVRSKHESFPSALIKALLSEISVFPPRTLVRLNTGEVGRVVGVNRNHPLRPKVEIISDSKGDRLPAPKLIDLSEAPFLYITTPLQEAGA